MVLNQNYLRKILRNIERRKAERICSVQYFDNKNISPAVLLALLHLKIGFKTFLFWSGSDPK